MKLKLIVLKETLTRMPVVTLLSVVARTMMMIEEKTLMLFLVLKLMLNSQ